jgi:hypothetical protein
MIVFFIITAGNVGVMTRRRANPSCIGDYSYTNRLASYNGLVRAVVLTAGGDSGQAAPELKLDDVFSNPQLQGAHGKQKEMYGTLLVLRQ